MARLSENQLKEALQSLPEWSINQDGELEKTYSFNRYPDGPSFAVEAGEEAEKADHHPTMIISYKKVTVQLITHDEDGLTEKDTALAAACDRRFESYRS